MSFVILIEIGNLVSFPMPMPHPGLHNFLILWHLPLKKEDKKEVESELASQSICACSPYPVHDPKILDWPSILHLLAILEFCVRPCDNELLFSGRY
jgi:hypothetical protein